MRDREDAGCNPVINAQVGGNIWFGSGHSSRSMTPSSHARPSTLAWRC